MEAIKMKKLIIILCALIILLTSIVGYLGYQHWDNCKKEALTQELIKKETKDFVEDVERIYIKISSSIYADPNSAKSLILSIRGLKNILEELNTIEVPENCISCFENLKSFLEKMIKSHFASLGLDFSSALIYLEEATVDEEQFSEDLEELKEGLK